MLVSDLIKKYGSAASTILSSIAGLALPEANVFFVDSGATNTSNTADNFHGQSWEYPFATLDYAIGKCTASQGDIILLAPGHAENVASATGCVLDIAGVSVIGLGEGTLVPTISLITAATATISITAPNCVVRNVRFVSNYTGGITAGITVGALADGLVLDNVWMTETSNTREYITGITVAAACNYLTIRGLRYYNTLSTDSLAAVTLAGATEQCRITDCDITGNFESAAILASAAAGTNIVIKNNAINNPDATAGLSISLHASTTGNVIYNHVLGGKDGTVAIAAAGCMCSQNYGTNAAGASGIIRPAVDS